MAALATVIKSARREVLRDIYIPESLKESIKIRVKGSTGKIEIKK